ncbi:MAG: acyltransferase family protein [Planctomycetia bacterium]
MTSTVPGVNPAYYRPDIDGLRAVAVLAVLIFHFGGWLSGGFVGVDVFFVISGFLITGILAREVEQGTFSLRRFWTRRLRRIAPASLVVTVVTLLAGLLILMPYDLVPLAKATIAQQTMLTNVYEWRNMGYFETNRPRPLLHMWSLAVEEQFYFFYPLLFAWLPMHRRGLVRAILWGAMLVSLVLSVYATSYRAGLAGFFLLPFRAWELLLGGLAALEMPRRPLGAARANALAMLGLGLIVVPCITYSGQMQFPGLAALPPCLGACFLIFAGTHDRTLVGRILSSRVAVAIGLVSYSLYLWHWPLHVYASYGTWGATPVGVTVMLSVASFVLAWLSWRWIETPFRHGMRSIGFAEALRIVAAAAVVLIITSVAIQRGAGLPGRYPERAEVYFRPTENDRRDQTFQAMVDVRSPDLLVRKFDGTAASGSPVDCLVWGDSHSGASLGLLGELFEEHGVRGAWATRNAHYPLLGTTRPMPAFARKPWIEWGNDVVARVRTDKIERVIIVADWPSVASAALDERTFAADVKSLGRSTLTRSLLHTCRTLNEAGATVWLIEPQPYQPADPLRWLVWSAALGRPVPHGVDRAEYDRVQGPTLEAFAVAAAGGDVRITPARDAWFNAAGKSFIGDDSHAYFTDGQHVSPEGMRRVYRGPFEAMVRAIAAELGRGDAGADPPPGNGDGAP